MSPIFFAQHNFSHGGLNKKFQINLAVDIFFEILDSKKINSMILSMVYSAFTKRERHGKHLKNNKNHPVRFSL